MMGPTLRTTLLSGVAVLLGACASSPQAPKVPDVLVPAGGKMLEVIAARGVQIYQCRAKTGGGAEWVFTAPDADLNDSKGQPAGRHYAGPHWEARDGSRFQGTVKSRAEASTPTAIPWLLLTARSVGPDGRWSKVTSVQRINTVGGVAPTSGCDAGKVGSDQRVPYTADYVLFTS